MKILLNSASLLIVVLIASPALALSNMEAKTNPASQIDVRVGIVAYEDFHGEYEQFEHLFAELSNKDPQLHFQIAVGSYGDVLHWIDRQLVDIAILTPGVFAGLLPRDDQQAAKSCRYLSTVQLPPASSKWATAKRQAKGFHNSYRSVCLVSESSSLKSVADLKKALRENRIELLFVHPISVSGKIVPDVALRQAGIIPTTGQVRFTYSHSQSIRLLREAAHERERVAFVWDDAAGNDPSLEAGVRKLSFPELDQLEIPHDVIVSRSDFVHSQRIQSLLLGDLDRSQRYRFTKLDDWEEQFQKVRGWLEVSGANPSAAEEEKTSLDEIGQQLLQYSRSQPTPPRLAVVLSGGGAKCSYQVGVVTALEEKLAELRRDNPQQGLDIALVVGTSGGAINSLPIAMGISSSKEGQQAFRETWLALDQREIVSPSLLIRANMGLWFALIQSALVIYFVRWYAPQPEKQGRTFVITYALLAAVQILIGYGPGIPWSWLGTNHLWHHAWLWISFGVKTSAWSLLALGLGVMLMEAVKARRSQAITIPPWLIKTTLLAGFLGLPLLQIITILTYEETLSGGDGMQHTLAEKFPNLINQHLQDNNFSPLELDQNADDAKRLQNVSRQLIRRRLLARDLVITGSCLSQTSQDLPSDLYFYAPADPSSVAPPFGDRGISLLERPEILLDVIMGSGSIYPMFPARKIDNLPRPGEQIELVDGGFAHNSPVEAAVLWGATHIILIEATPRKRNQRGAFLKNIGSSFHHLHQQAQLLDAKSRERVTVFSLSPQPPHICVLDFADNLISASIERGYQDASINAALANGRFTKEMGEPVFWKVRRSE